MKKEQTPNSSLSDGQPVVAAPPVAQAGPHTSPSPSPAYVPPPDPRRRMRELLAIPDSQRSDALWDELIELEIQLAPGNRISDPSAEGGGRGVSKPKRPEGRPPHEATANKAPNPNKPAKPRFNKKPKPPRQDAGPKES
ncbi:MAG TPA: hypothetical protein VJ001_08585 [Rhodocyclaceae bacterium]|nr:hypothetical protein [Rhodocyclaceae bacterium]